MDADVNFQFHELVDKFKLQVIIKPFDPDVYVKRLPTAAQEDREVMLFLLNVYSHGNWPEKFDLMAAVMEWPEWRREILIGWIEAPVWPAIITMP